MNTIHTPQCAKRHTEAQVPIATLHQKAIGGFSYSMTKSFRDALIWHMEQDGTTKAELSRATGVSRDILNKLFAREDSSTAVENAILIAAYYGKNVERFIACDEKPGDRRLAALTELLQPEEERLLEAQVRGLLQRRGSR